MADNSGNSPKKNFKIRILLAVTIMIMAAMAAYAYYNSTFPDNRCEYGLEHLKGTDTASDCYECHKKTTPKIAQDWYESKHGVMLVKCFVCHGQPDGKGSVPYSVNPDVNTTCRKCHDTSINMMESKYGLEPECNGCHPFHNNSLHHKAYVKTKTKKSLD